MVLDNALDHSEVGTVAGAMHRYYHLALCFLTRWPWPHFSIGVTSHRVSLCTVAYCDLCSVPDIPTFLTVTNRREPLYRPTVEALGLHQEGHSEGSKGSGRNPLVEVGTQLASLSVAP